MCTALEKLKEDGKMEGIEEKEKAVILVMLKNNYPISEICKISGATEETVLEIKQSGKGSWRSLFFLRESMLLENIRRK